MGGGVYDDSNFSFFNHPRLYFYVPLSLSSLSFIFASAVFMVHIILCWPVTVVYLI